MSAMSRKAKARRRRLLFVVIATLVVSGLGGGAVALMRSILTGAAPAPKKLVQEIKVIRPPPPPPDLPPPPPPPPEEKVNIPDPQPKADPKPSDEPPPSENLGLDQVGNGAGDSFGLVGHPGGRELISSGGSVASWYGGLVRDEIRDQLSGDAQCKGKGDYRVSVQIWIRDDGSVGRVRVAQSNGDAKRDTKIEACTERLRISKPPPPEVPQPMTIGLVWHG